MTTIEIPNGANLDPYFKANRWDTVFRLGAGTYFCESSWNFKEYGWTMVGPGCSLIGAGSSNTAIVIRRETIPDDAWQVENLTAGNRDGICEGVELGGFKLLCSSDPRPKGRVAGQVGVHVWSDRAIIRDLEIRGVTGVLPTDSKHPSREGFGLLVNGPGRAVRCRGGAIIENVLVGVIGNRESKDGLVYVCAVYPGYVEPEEYTVARNVHVVTDPGVKGTVAYGFNSKVLASGLTSKGRWGRAIFCDTDGGHDVLVSDCIFDVEGTGLELHGNKWSDVFVFSSRFRFRFQNPSDTDFGAGVVLLGINRFEDFARIGMVGCVLEAEAGTKVPHYAGSVKGPASDVGLQGCRMIGPWNGQSTNHPAWKVT